MKSDLKFTRRSVLAAAGFVATAGAVISAKLVLFDDSDPQQPAREPKRTRVATTTAQLQQFVSDARSGDLIQLVASTVYVLTRTLQLRTSDVVIDGAGATVRLADGAERSSDRVLDVVASRCTVRNLCIARRSGARNGSAASWTVQVIGDRNTVQACMVDVAAGYAIGVAGGSGNLIADNVVTGGGILYGWNETVGTTCVRNTVSKTSGNAFSGIGNSDSGRPVRDCVVTDNIVEDCGRIAIEDFANIDGTRIERNRITRSAEMGISAVGARTTVAQNVIVDGGSGYGIETGASGNVVTGNTMSWSTVGKATGLIVNDRWKFGGTDAYTGFRSNGNTITRALIGIDLAGRLPDVVLDSDTVTDCGMRAISVEPTSARSVRITSATILFSSPAVARAQIRDGISVANVSNVSILKSTITFGPGSSGTSKDYFIRVEAKGTSITDCVFIASGRSGINRPSVGSVTGSISGRVTALRNRYVVD